MPDSMITQCPKCSTSFRVSADILSMAKGKVRCGQCFHIFEAQSHANQTIANHVPQPSAPTPKVSPRKESSPSTTKEKTPRPVKEKTNKPITEAVASNGHSPNLFTAATDDDIVNPDWLNTLISDDDLEPLDKQDQGANLNPSARQALANQGEDTPPAIAPTKVNAKILKNEDEPAPWEVELAALEAAQQHAKKGAINSNINTPSDPFLSMKDDDFFLDPETLARPSKSPLKNSQPHAMTNNDQSKKQASPPRPEPQPEPEYMQALQELAQSVSQTSGNKGTQGLQFNHDVSHNLGELMEDPNESSDDKNKHTWRWALACFVFIIISLIQLLVVNYETGSRSASLRPIYNIVCSYYGCEIPIFEDVKAIDIQHVRVQSHATKENALVVNAIMTNHSNFSQPMPKIAMEFYDLNGNPVAARLFSQQDFLDKDFLDITYMPPKTPIHLVISIADPGASAVTHKLKVYRAETRSY